MIIRPSVDTDVPAIAGIYGYHVQHGCASFEIDPPGAEEMARRWSEVRRLGLPWLVAELAGGAIAGYAYASPYRSRPAYRFTLEDSIYVHPDYAGLGIGSLLLAELIAVCERTEAKQMVAIIGDSLNASSIRLHEKFGFRHVGVLRAVGFKFGRWVDTVLMQRPLGPSADSR